MSLGELKANKTPYSERGWCVAEKGWASTKQTYWGSRSWRLDSRPAGAGKGPTDMPDEEFDALVPLAPSIFKEQVNQGTLKFTHRDDKPQVIELLEKVFREKATQRLEFEMNRAEQPLSEEQ